MRKILFSFALCAIMLFVGCNKEQEEIYNYDYTKQSDETLFFSSSDEDLDFFLNDYFKRHIGYVDGKNDMQVTSLKPGKTQEIFYQEWSSLSLYWFNSFSGLESDRISQARARLSSIPVDNYGYVWQTDDTVRNAEENLTQAYHSMGWPFPNSTHSFGNSRSWDFNGYDVGESWTSNFGAAIKRGIFVGETQDKLNSIYFDSPALSGIDTILSFHAPLLELDLRMFTSDYENIEDVYIWFKNDAEDSWSEEKKVSLSEKAFIDYDFSSVYEHIFYVPMYAHPSWNSDENKEIAQIRIEVKAKEGKAIGGSFGLNYLRPIYDTRHSNNNTILINSLKTDYEYTGDIDYLKANVVRARKAMNFLLQMYDSNRKLNRQSYLVGHEGNKEGDSPYDRMGKSLPNGYWDILFMTEYDFQSNMNFYKSLRSLIFIEKVLESNSINIDKNLSSVITAVRTGGYGVGEYTYTTEQLETIADNVLEALRKNTDDATKEGFFDPDTGRFICG